MKIIIQGSIFSTEDIFEISEICSLDECSKLGFEIIFYNNKRKWISIETGCAEGGWMFKNGETYEAWEHRIKQSDKYKEVLAKLTAGYKELVDIWSNNQSEIPEIKLI